MEARFDVHLSPSKKQELVLHSFPVLFGRQGDCKVRITSRLVSRRHCELSEQDGKLYVSDLGSSNGTFINGQRISGETELASGDELEVGPVRMIVSYDGADNAAANDDSVVLPPIVVSESNEDPNSDARDTHQANSFFDAVEGDGTSLVSDSGPDSDDFWKMSSDDSSGPKSGESPF